MIHRFGTFEFDPDSGQLSKAGRRVRLEPQPARLLALLVARPGEIVTRDELKRQIWSDGTHVDFDRGLAFCLAQVRTALGDAAENPRFIETLPRRGVRFIAPVTAPDRPQAPADAPVQAAAASPRASRTGSPGPMGEAAMSEAAISGAAMSGAADIAPARARPVWLLLGAGALAAAAIVAAGVWAFTLARGRAPERPTVAVAIFDNETGHRELDPLASQVSDVIVARLTAIDPAQLGVIGNSRVLRVPRDERDLRAIARETAATFVILGQVQNDDAGVRTIVHLIRLADGTHVWAHRVVRRADDLTGVEDSIAAAVEQAIRTRVLRAASATSSSSSSSPAPATR